MSPHALLVACLLLGARAAPRAPALDDIELDVLEPSNEVPPVADNVPLVPAEVKGVSEEALQLKRLDENSNDFIPDPNSEGGQRKVPLDLKNPGPPQRQEHETQNQSPGHYGTQERALITIQEKLDQARNTFNEQIKSVSSSFDALVHGSDNLPVIHEQVRHLKSSFSVQLDELNNTIQSYVRPCGEDLKTSLKPDDEPKDIESNLKEVQHNFDNGISMISEGLELISILKEEDEAALKMQAKDDAGTTSTTTLAPATVAQTQGFFQNAFNTFSNMMSNSFANFQSGLSNLAGQGVQQAQPAPPANAQADAPTAPSTQRPIAQGIQSISNFFSNILNRPQTPAILQPQANQPSNAVGSQLVPASSPQQQASPQPQVQPTVQPQPAPVTQPGPIAQFIQSNPIVQRVTSFLRPRPTAQPLQQPAQPQAQPLAQSPQPLAQPLQQPAQPQAQPQAQPLAQSPQQQPQSQPQPEFAQPPEQAQPQAAKPQAAQPQAAQPAQAQPGPIQQIVQNNPIIRGLQAAVQRVQNPRPQDPSKPRENEEEKGHGGYGGNNQGYNRIDSDSGVATQASEVKNLGQDAVTQEVKEQEIKETPSDEKTEA